jgi:hypothetical protein
MGAKECDEIVVDRPPEDEAWKFQISFIMRLERPDQLKRALAAFRH